MGSLVLTSCAADVVSPRDLEAINGGLPPNDWAQFTTDFLTPANRRLGGGSTITCAYFGANTESNATDARTVSFTNGTPTSSGSSASCVFNSSFAAGNGFTLTFPASTTPRRAYIVCGPYNTSPDTITGSISGTALTLADTTSLTGATGAFNPFLVVVDYTADGPGETLTLNFFAGLVGAQTVTLQGAAWVDTASPPTINVQPAPATVFVGSTATFTVSASGTGTLHYQWKFNGSNVGTDSTSYTTPATDLSYNGAIYTVDVTDSNGTTTSANAILTVIPTAVLAWLKA